MQTLSNLVTNPSAAEPLRTPASAPHNSASMILNTLTHLTFGPRNAFPLYIPVADLHNATDNGLEKMKSRTLARLRRRVYVESTADSRSDDLFFVPLPTFATTSVSATPDAHNPAPVEYAAVKPSSSAAHLVLSTDDFEVALVGMHAGSQDNVFDSGSELLLYSLRDLESANVRRADYRAGFEDVHPRTRMHGHRMRAAERENRWENRAHIRYESGSDSSSGAERGSGRNAPQYFAYLNARDDAKIHYDPVIDGHDQSTSPDTYVAVPGRKGLMLQHRGDVDAHIDTVEARFTVVEVDTVSPSQRRGVKKFGNVLTTTVDAVPFGKLFAPAISGMSSMATSVLDRFERPDHVISRDVLFRLLSRLPTAGESVPANSNRPMLYADNYLRYGYYFFLARKVDAQLYAQNDTSSQTVPLLLRRTGRRQPKECFGEREFFPLTGVNYVVMKVTPGCLHGRVDRTARQREQDLERLGEILKMKKAMDLLRGRA